MAYAVTTRAMHEHRRFLVELARRHGRGIVDPDDLAQDVLERWVRAASCPASIANPHAWMRVVTRRLIIDRLRRRGTLPVTSNADIEGFSVEPEVSPWWRELDAAAVECALTKLPPALRETFRLFVFEGRSYKQISAQLQIAMGTVAVRISRARAQLKRRLIECTTRSRVLTEA